MAQEKTGGTKKVLGMMSLTFMSVAAVMSLKNVPVMSEYGFTLVFYLLFGTIFFFLPLSLISAELATGWPKKGGIYVWVKEGLGPKWGVAAAWFHWVESFFWYPTAFAFVAATISYIFNPELATNKLYNVTLIIGCMWLFTIINFAGMKLSSMISTIGVILGTIIPGVLIIVLGVIWVLKGNPFAITMSLKTFLPEINNMSQVTLLAGMGLVFVGIELIGYHANEVKDPQRNFPKAIMFAGIVIFLLNIIGALSIAIVVPKDNLSLTAGIMEAIEAFLRAYNLHHFTPWIAALTALGTCAMASTWIPAPAKGVEVPAREGYLPPFFAKDNRNNMPVGALIIQALAVTIVALAFLFMPSINSAMWLLIALVVQIYILMYFLMFIAAVRLRYTQPDVKRSYRIPGGNAGMWIVAGIGFLTSLFTFLTGFWPKQGINTVGKIIMYEAFLIGGMIIVCAPAFIFYALRKPSWKKEADSGGANAQEARS